MVGQNMQMTALEVSHKDKNIIERTLCTELLNVSRWMSDNRLSESILFGSNFQKMKKASDFKVLAGDSEMTANESVSYLGCVLDGHLSGVGHAQKVITKIKKKIIKRFLARIAKSLDQKTMLILAGALIQPSEELVRNIGSCKKALKQARLAHRGHKISIFF